LSDVFPDWPVTVINVVNFELSGNTEAGDAVVRSVATAGAGLPEVEG
jgi:hypothetical protein